jgi:hypothetical protein
MGGKKKAVRRMSITQALIWTLFWVLFDVYLMGIPFLGLVLLLCFSVVALVKFFRTFETTTWKRTIAYPLSPILGIAAIVIGTSLNWSMGRNNADKVIHAVETFHARTGEYPQSLNDLVPGYLDKLPRSAIRSFLTDYDYFVNGSSHTLFYVKIPPTGRSMYDFESKSWGFMD